MIFDIALPDLAFQPFFNISKHFLLVWSLINFLKCWYVATSIANKRLPPFIAAIIFTGITITYLIKTLDFTWLLIFQLLDLYVIVYLILTRDSMCLLGLLSITIYFLKPFAYIVDVFVILFISIDFPIVFFENSPFWTVKYINCLIASAAFAEMNSHGQAKYMFIPNLLYVCIYGAISWNARNRRRTMPVFVANVVYVMSQFNRDDPIRFGAPEFEQLRRNVFPF